MRILLSETVDPDGAMCRWMSPDLEAMGHQVAVVPTQEAIHRLGISGYQRLLLDLGEHLCPDLILVHPPYDHLNLQICQQLRQHGARLVTYAFDDDIFLDDWGASSALDELLHTLPQMADLVLTTSSRMADAAAQTSAPRTRLIRWAMSQPPQSAKIAPSIPARAVLIGRAYSKRIELVQKLAAAGIPVLARGHGWEQVEGLGDGVEVGAFVDSDAMWELYRSAGVVLTTGGWEDRDVAMVKIRVLEAAFAGACQVVAWSPDLERYFAAPELPSYHDFDDLVALLKRLLPDADAKKRYAEAGLRRATREHTWLVRFQEILTALADVDRPALDSPPVPLDCASYALLFQGLATTAEATGRHRAAAAFYAHADQAGAGPSARLGWCRCQFHLDAPAPAAERLADGLIDALDALVHPGPRRLHVHINSPDVGTGLGQARLLSPGIEARAYLLASLARTAPDDALAVLNTIYDPDLLVHLASLLSPEEQGEPFWRALLTRALAAHPRALLTTQQQSAPGWRAWLTANPGRRAGEPG